MRKNKMTSLFVSQFPLQELEVDGVIVSYEDSLETLLSYFSQKQAEAFVELLHESLLHPKKSLHKALSWKVDHPKNPIVDNLLTFLYLQNKERGKAEELMIESYQTYPNYFFAQINYADQCLRKKKLKEVALIFPSFDLCLLFPDKKKYHVSEFRGFMILASRYHLSLKKKELAEKYYKNAYAADPSHPSVIALEKTLYSQKSFSKFFTLCYAFLVKMGRKKLTSAPLN